MAHVRAEESAAVCTFHHRDLLWFTEQKIVVHSSTNNARLKMAIPIANRIRISETGGKYLLNNNE